MDPASILVILQIIELATHSLVNAGIDLQKYKAMQDAARAAGTPISLTDLQSLADDAHAAQAAAHAAIDAI